jgi:hypothetical protein
MILELASWLMVGVAAMVTGYATYKYRHSERLGHIIFLGISHQIAIGLVATSMIYGYYDFYSVRGAFGLTALVLTILGLWRIAAK